MILQDPKSQNDLKTLRSNLVVVASLIVTQKILRIAVEHGMGVALEYMDQESPLSLDDAEKKRLDEVLRSRKRKAAEAKIYTPNKKPWVDRSKDVCRVCGGIGHWWQSPQCPKYKREDRQADGH